MPFVLGQKYYVRNWTVTKFCDIGTGDYRFRFSAQQEVLFSSAFSFTTENEKCIFRRPLLRLYIKLFQITKYDDDFQTFNNPGSGQPVDALKN